MTGTILYIRQRESRSEVHSFDCPVIGGEATAGQFAFTSVVVAPIQSIEDGTFLAKLADKGSDPRFQPCCLLDDDGELDIPILDDLEDELEVLASDRLTQGVNDAPR